MELSFPERLALVSILPTENDYATLRIAWLARMMLAPTPDEIKEYEIVQEGTMVKWNVEKTRDYHPDILLDDASITMLRQKLVELDRNKKLTQNTYSLYEKLVMGYQQL
jgi:hypothetical protein